MVNSRQFLISVLTACIACLATPARADYADTPPEDVFRTDARRYGHLEFFGFFASAMFSWNFTQELAPFTNLTWIHVGSAENPVDSARRMVNRIREARDAGVFAVVSIEPFLFRDDEGHPRTEQEIEDFLIELRARIENEDLLDTVAMIYPKDEPFRNFRRARDPDFIDRYITGDVYDDIHQDLVYVNQQIKQVFPEVPLGAILSGNEIFHKFFSIPENYDWVGFDCYTNLFSGCDEHSHVEFYRRLLNHMQPHQRLMAVPETWVTPEGLERPDWPDVLLKRLRHHYEMVLSEPRFIAIVPFLWSSDLDGEPPGQGLNRIPEYFDDGVDNLGTAFLDSVIDIGLQVKFSTFENPNLAYAETEDHAARPASEIRGGILAVNRQGLISAWAVNHALPHKNLRVRVRVRDELGRLLHRSDIERTFIRDDSLVEPDRIGQAFVGTHGFRYQIPRKILYRHRGETLRLRFTVFADGDQRIAAFASRYKYRLDPRSASGL